MDDQQQRITEDLAGAFTGELRFDALTREMYSTDGSLYQVRPLGVAFPRCREDVQLLARYSAENYIPLTARGAGTGVAGGALNQGLIIDFSRHMTAIERIDSDTVRVQPGVVRDHLNRRLRETGRYFAPDPANSALTTVGSMLAIDAAGSHAVEVGSTRDHVESIEVVLADGTTIEADSVALGAPLTPASDSDTAEREMWGTKQEIVQRLKQLISSNAELIEQRQPPLIRNCSGYHLRTVLRSERLHLPRLLIGSEGTLGLFTSATLQTLPLPAERSVSLILFGEFESAIRAVQEIVPLEPSACDLLDRRILSLAREADPRFAALIPKNTEAALLVEHSGVSATQVRDRMQRAIRCARSVDRTAVVAREAYTPDDVEFLWSLPYRVVPLLIRLRGETRPLPIVEDIAVPPEVLRDFLISAQRVFQKHWVTASLYAHAASGQIHLRPFLKIPSPDTANAIESLARDLYQVVVTYGGTISGEHGDGLARTAFIRTQYGPLYRVFQQVKDLFDPHNLLNPGKIISDDPHLTIKNLRPVPRPHVGERFVPLQLAWSGEELADATLRCNGCGACRTDDAELRMCPFFRNAPDEEASPRSKANVLRGTVSGTLDPREMLTDDARRLASVCFNCKQCEIECPANVNIPHLMVEARAQYVSNNGLSRANWILSRAHSFGELGCRFAPFANWALNHAGLRWVIEKAIGISRRRRLPAFARRTFLSKVKRTLGKDSILSSGQSPIAYFVDQFVNYHDHELGEAFVRILHHNGIDVYVPPKQTASGMAMFSAGDLDAARELAVANIRALAPLAQDGIPIVCTEPTAAICLTQEYPQLVDHPDLADIGDCVVEAGQFLSQLHQEGRLRTDFAPLPAVAAYHTPCHVKALRQGTPFADLLKLIPEFDLHKIERGCSGMAGAFGLTADNFERSLELGSELLGELQRPQWQLGVTECSSCRLQMVQSTTMPTLHPLKLLALSYGLMPELAQRLHRMRWSLVTS